MWAPRCVHTDRSSSHCKVLGGCHSLDICGGPVERANRMSVRENSLLYRRTCPQKDGPRRSVMRHRVRTPPRRHVSVVRLPSHREARLPRMSVQEHALCYRSRSHRSVMRHRRAYPPSEARLRRAYVPEARLRLPSLFVVVVSVVVVVGPVAVTCLLGAVRRTGRIPLVLPLRPTPPPLVLCVGGVPVVVEGVVRVVPRPVVPSFSPFPLW